MAKKTTVVVTGISGYVGRWVARELLARGYAVRGTLRDPARAGEVRQALAASLGGDPGKALAFVTADLLDDKGWKEAISGADALMHVAARVVAGEPRDPQSVIRPAREGTRNVLSAARAVGVTRVVMTSSIATIGYGHGQTSGVRTYTESDWTLLDCMRWPWAYCTGKTLAERDAWTYAEASGLELTTIHPGMILGPVIGDGLSPSVTLITGLLAGRPSAYPNMGFSLSDVRDVAEMHVAALESPRAVGERYLSTSGYIRFAEIAAMLHQAYPDAPVPRRAVPDWLLRLLVIWMRDIRQIINDIGNEKHFDGTKGRALLGHDYRRARQTILDCAESLHARSPVEV